MAHPKYKCEKSENFGLEKQLDNKFQKQCCNFHCKHFESHFLKL